MPTRAPHPCATNGCPTLVTRGSYCAEHERKALASRPRDEAQARFYRSTRWRKLSEHVRRRDPVCRVCRCRPSTQADHVSGDYNDNREENLQGICKACHNEKSGREHAGKRF